MSAVARLDRAGQRRVLALMGVDVYVVRPKPPARLVVHGDASDRLVGAIVRALGLAPDAVAFAASSAPTTGPSIAFGGERAAGSEAVHLPALERLRADGKAKREAWRALRRLAKRS